MLSGEKHLKKRGSGSGTMWCFSRAKPVWTVWDSRLPCQSLGKWLLNTKNIVTWEAQAAVLPDCVVFALTGKICQSSCLGVWEGEHETFSKQTETQSHRLLGRQGKGCRLLARLWRSLQLGKGRVHAKHGVGGLLLFRLGSVSGSQGTPPAPQSCRLWAHSRLSAQRGHQLSTALLVSS